MKANRLITLALALAGMLLPAGALADSITPETFSATLAVGESVTIEKTVTVSAGLPTSALVDVLFLMDTTGSMTDAIDAARESATTIMNRLSGLGDVAFGVARYDDFPIDPYGYDGSYEGFPVPDSPYQVVQTLTDSTSLVTGALGSLDAYMGNDGPESNLYALTEAANTFGWREESNRIIVWLGDSPGHDPSLEPEYAFRTGSTADLDTTIAALVDNNITVDAINFGYYYGWGLDAGSVSSVSSTWDYTVSLDGQATAIADATGGGLYTGTTSSQIATVIAGAITTTFDKYTQVSLNASGAAGSVVFSGPITGSFDRSVDRTFTFTMTYTAAAPGIDDFTVAALVDGGQVALETDSITVPGADVPEPNTLLLLGMGVLGLGVFSRGLKGR